jgi:hypothetical protein
MTEKAPIRMSTNSNQKSVLKSVISRIGHDESGFSMISAITALMVGTLLSLAAWATANSDINFTDKDRWARVAYQRAQSGVSDYIQHMAENSGYWRDCDRPDGVTDAGLGQVALNDNDFGASDHPIRRWLPYSAAGTTDDRGYNAQYTIDLMPTSGSCKPKATAADRMIDPASGTFKVRVTGRAGPLVPTNVLDANVEAWRQKNWKKVSLVAEFRRNGFLDYGYFSDHESRDPLLLKSSSGLAADTLALQKACNGYYQDDPGYDKTIAQDLQEPHAGRWRKDTASGDDCVEIQFADGDTLAGPFHSNDGILVGGPPTDSDAALFGNNARGDRVEVYDNGKSNCPVRTSSSVNYDTKPNPTNADGCYKDVRKGTGVTFVYGAAARYLDLPEDNDDLQLYADPDSGDPDSQGFTFLGKTQIELENNGKFKVTNAGVPGGFQEYDYPTSGVIYVDNNGVSSCQSDPYFKPYSTSITPGCALLEVKGTYNKSLTLGSAADIVITGNILRGSSQSAVLGLIANQYVRVRHYPKVAGDKNYVNGYGGSCTSDNTTATAPITTIQSAILTLNRSFTVDGYQCGNQLGDLSFQGSLAQRWRGTVGTGGCGSGTGYCKDYSYDYTFKSQSPPHYLAPSAATWKVIRMRQTLPACPCGTTN